MDIRPWFQRCGFSLDLNELFLWPIVEKRRPHLSSKKINMKESSRGKCKLRFLPVHTL